MSSAAPNPPNDDASLLPPDWKDLQPLLDQLLDAPSEERAARVIALSGGNAILQRQLEGLLAEADRDMPLLDQAIARCFDELAKDGSDVDGARQVIRGLDARPPAWGTRHTAR